MSDIRENLNLSLTLTANLTHDGEDAPIAAAKYTFGVGRLPTREEVNDALDEMIAHTEEMTGKTGWRLTTMSDFGFADPKDFGWQR
jgi:hypothetical protein